MSEIAPTLAYEIVRSSVTPSFGDIREKCDGGQGVGCFLGNANGNNQLRIWAQELIPALRVRSENLSMTFYFLD
jgi:hypothetical protein